MHRLAPTGTCAKPRMKRLRLAMRLLRVGAHLLRGVLECALLFPLLGDAARARRVQRWSGALTHIFGITIVASGALPINGGALVANHVSWLDVFVINALSPCTFIAKSEVRQWPVIGWLSARAGTVFIARDRPSSLRTANKLIARQLAEGRQLAFFPEGTSAAQGAMQPFHANLFQGVVMASAAVYPVALVYRDVSGALSARVEYIGHTTLGQSIVRLLSGERCVAHLCYLPALASSSLDRRGLAAAAHAAIHGYVGDP